MSFEPLALVVYSGGFSFDWQATLAPRGIRVVAVPSHRITFAAEESILGGLEGDFSRIVITSRNSVEALCRYRTTASRLRKLARQASVVAVGPETARRLEENEIFVLRAHAGGNVDSLLSNLPTRLKGERILVPRGDDADPRLADALRRRGAEVVEVIVYDKEVASEVGDLPKALADPFLRAYVVTSPNAASWLFEKADESGREKLKEKLAVAMGPTTAGRLRDLGAVKVVTPEEPSFAAVAETVAKFLLK